MSRIDMWNEFKVWMEMRVEVTMIFVVGINQCSTPPLKPIMCVIKMMDQPPIKTVVNKLIGIVG